MDNVLSSGLLSSGPTWPRTAFVHLGVSPSARWGGSGRGACCRLDAVPRHLLSPCLPEAQILATWLGCQAGLVLRAARGIAGAKSGGCLTAGVHLALDLEQVDSGGGPAPRQWDLGLCAFSGAETDRTS